MFTPFFLMYGRQAKLPVECEMENASQDATAEDRETTATLITDDSTEDEIQARLTAINHVRSAISKDACNNIIKAQDTQKRDYTKRHGTKRAFVEGDEVLLWNLRRVDRKGGRMKDSWLGPYKIGHVADKNTYELLNKEGIPLRQKAHGVNLKLFVKPKGSVHSENCRCSEDNSSPGESLVTDADEPLTMNAGTVTSHISVDGVEDVSLIIVEAFSFKPTTAAWRKRLCAKLSLPPPKRLPVRQRKEKLGIPCKLNSMAKDGNCFFRTIAYELCGAADHHQKVRDVIVTYMSADANSTMFSQYIGKQVMTYLTDSHMHNEGIWATDVEIVASATLLQTSIYVYSDVSGEARWFRYKPLVTKDKGSCNENIYITNLHQHFERVVAVE